MYIPRHFRETDEDKIFRFISEYNFGILLTADGGGITGSHIPFLADRSGGPIRLTTHLAAANDQLEQLRRKADCLVIFNGPHAYVSPSLYAEQQNVPTWNFIAVHLYGKHRVTDDFEEKKHILERSISTFESAYMDRYNALDTAYRDRLIHATTGLEIEVKHMEAKYKLSQNRSPQSRQHVADHFRETGHELGKLME